MANEIKKRNRRGAGSVFQKPIGNDKPWHIQYYRYNPDTERSERVREYCGLPRAAAQRLLNDRLGKLARGEQFEVGRPRTVGELYKALHTMTLNNARPGSRAAKGLGWRWAHLGPFFGAIRAANVTTAKVEEYKVQRREEHAAPATINRELHVLRRLFRYGKQSTPPTVHQIPYIRMFSEKDNVRKGFIEQDAFERMAAEAAKEGLWLRALVEVAFTYGWRIGELLDLRVRQVDLRARTIRLDPGTTKNDEGREVTMTPEVEELLRAAVDGKGPDDFVFTRENGKPVKDFRGAWKNLCARVGVGHWECSRKCGAVFESGGRVKCACGGTRRYVGLIVHDFRRSAARALRRAGVPESVIMATGGWKTPSMFRRYAIVSSADQRAAMQALEQARQQLSPPFSPLAPKTARSTDEREATTVQ